MNIAVFVLAAISMASPPSIDAQATADPVIRAMRDELARTLELSIADSPSPHYVAYHLFDADGISVVARFGALADTNEFRVRQLSPTVRVGSSTLDAAGFSGRMDLLLAPWDDDYDALRHRLWMLSDDMYKTATERFRQEQASRKQTTRDKDAPDSFSEAPTNRWVGSTVDTKFDQARFEVMASDASAVFRDHTDIQTSWVSMSAVDLRHRFVASDGALVDESRTIAEVQVWAAAQADDGLPIRRSASVLVLDPTKLPDAAGVKALAHRVATETDEARAAQVADNYEGPVLFKGRAAAQLMAYVLPQELTAMPFSSEDGRLGRRVLPASVSIVDDPTLTEFEGEPLFGHYEVDYEGVAGTRVSLVEKGKQVGMLMGRTPNHELGQSNGHARGTFPGMTMVSPGNLIVQTKGGSSDKALRAKLLKLLAKEGLEHGFIVTELGNSPWTPARVVRIDSKGKTTRVRVDQMRLPEFKDLRRLVAVGNDPAVYNYLAAGGSPTGGLGGGAQETVVPASVVSPSMLFDQVQFKKASGDKPKPPPYPHPYFAKNK